MDGLIHDRLDIKILILYILSRLPKAIERETLAELALFDAGIGYFDLIECLGELCGTGHVLLDENDRYSITESGRVSGASVEESLPFTVRKSADTLLRPVAAELRRSTMIRTEHKISENGLCFVSLALSDGVGDIISLRLLVSDEAEAELMESKFRVRAEKLYHDIVKLLLDDEPTL